MQELEEKIISKFDEVGDAVVAERAGDSDFELKKILDFFGEPEIGHNKLLDVGCGKGKFLSKFSEKGFEVAGIEPSQKLLDIATKNNPSLKLLKASVTDIPFPDNTFDYLVCVEVLEHVPDTERAIREMSRVLKLGGKMIIIDKNICSLHPRYFIPTFLWKWFLEKRNRWMYPSDFLFKERYFNPHQLNKLLKNYFSQSKVRFIRYESEKKKRPLAKTLLLGIHQLFSFVFYKIFSFLNLYVAWEAVK